MLAGEAELQVPSALFPFDAVEPRVDVLVTMSQCLIILNTALQSKYSESHEKMQIWRQV